MLTVMCGQMMGTAFPVGGKMRLMVCVYCICKAELPLMVSMQNVASMDMALTLLVMKGKFRIPPPASLLFVERLSVVIAVMTWVPNAA